MRGTVLGYDMTRGSGEILGSDGVQYTFVGDQVKSGWPLANGQEVNFEVGSNGLAFDIHAIFGGQMLGSGGYKQSLDMGRVFNRTFAAIKQNGLIYFGAAAVLVGIPQLMTMGMTPNIETGAPSPAGVVIGVIGWLAFIVGSYLLQGGLVKSAFNSFSGKSTDPQDSFKEGLRKFLPLLGLAIISTLGISLALLLFIIPGLILMVLWIVGVPVLVVEKRGVFESLQRSQDLTKGYRWPLFGIAVIYFFLAMLVQLMIGLLFGGIGAVISQPLIMNAIGGVISNVVACVVSAVGVSALYYELRTVKEGALVDDLAAVFD